MKTFFNSIVKPVVIAGLLLVSPRLFAASATVSVAGGVMTNFSLLVGNSPVKVTQVIITSAGTNQASVNMIDTYTNWLVYTNAAYSNTLTYVTNFVSVWTNYYGVTNTVTNSASLIDVTNNLVAGTTNIFPVRMSISTPTNSSTKFDNVNYYFQNGVWVSNVLAGGTCSVTITYQQ